MEVKFYSQHSKLECAGQWPSQEEMYRVSELDQAYFPFPWSRENWQALERTAHYHLLMLAWERDHLLGFMLFAINDQEGPAHLLKILVHPKWRRQKLAARWLESAQDKLANAGWKRMYLEVLTSNSAALAFYKQQGLCELALAPNFYGRGKDAVRMERSLGS